MTARTMPTPIGPVAIRATVVELQSRMSDRQIADKAFAGQHGDPEAYAELLHRGLSGPGMSERDTYRLIEQREAEAHAPCHMN